MEDSFVYYTDRQKKEKRAAVGFAGTEFSVGWDKGKLKTPSMNLFTITTPERKYYFCAETFHVLQQWQDAFSKVLFHLDSPGSMARRVEGP